MTREEILKLLQSDNLTNQQRRELDFLLRRAPSEKDVEQVTERSLGNGKIVPPQSLAAKRLEQLRIFRQKQEADAADLSPVEGDTLRRDMVESGKLNWVNIGPAGVEKGQATNLPVVSGRVRGICVASGGQRIYLGAANGGVWYSGDGGKNWVSLMDGVDYFPNPIPTIGRADSLSVGALAVIFGDGKANDTIFVGTGEGDFISDAYMGVGVLASKDGGVNWKTEASNVSLVGEGFFAFAVDPDDSEKVVAATKIGIYIRELVGGNTYKWEQRAFEFQRVWSLVVSKGIGGKRFYAAVENGAGQTEIHASTDGINWELLNNGFSTTRSGRTSLAVQPNNPNFVYAMVATNGGAVGAASLTNPIEGHMRGVYRLDWNAARKWTQIIGKDADSIALLQHVFGNDPIATPGQGGYDNCIAVSPSNLNHIYIGGSIRKIAPDKMWSGSIYRCELEVVGAVVQAKVIYIGEQTHADVHVLTTTPNEANQLWVGCDGGIFVTDAATAANVTFQSRNAGLQTFVQNHIGLNLWEEENFFVSTQDNGANRYLDGDIYLHSFGGDSGYCVVNWAHPNRVVATYARELIYKDITGGNRPADGTYGYESQNIPLTRNAANAKIEPVLFYAPLVGVPYKNAMAESKADFLAFGTNRVWISTDFSTLNGWKPIPSLRASHTPSYNTDRLDGLIHALTFESDSVLYAGTGNGGVYKFTDASGNWSNTAQIAQTKLNTNADEAHGSFLIGKTITCIAIMPGGANQIYVTLGSSGGTRRVWFYDGAVWSDRSAGLIDVSFNAIVINPLDTNQVFAGSDVGVWKYDAVAATWSTFSFGLPEVAVVDLKIFSPNDKTSVGAPTLLRASTHGRGVYECVLSEASTPNVKLFLRGNALDRGRYSINLDKFDPRTTPSVKIDKIETPDIKIDIPDSATGNYQIAANESLSADRFQAHLTDKASQVPVPVSGDALSHVYVRVHSRGIMDANNVHVWLLMTKNAGAAIPDLPANYHETIRAGGLIDDANWKTIALKQVHGVKAGVSKVVRFDLSSANFDNRAGLAAGNKLTLLALLHHQTDAFGSTLVKIDPSVTANNLILSTERKAMFKQLTIEKPAEAPPSVNPPAHKPMMGFVSIPESAVVAEAPLDAFLGLSYILNDELLHAALASRLAQPFSNRGVDMPTTDEVTGRNVYMAKNIVVNRNITVGVGVPMIWMAREKVTIGKKINAKGKGAVTEAGDFGGGGGGGATEAGAGCTLPLVNPAIATVGGGAMGNTVGEDANPTWSSRAMLMPQHCKGGGKGGNHDANEGGKGGGVVIICAPTIEFIEDGEIDASGANGAANAGGGGGGVIILIASEIIGHTDDKTKIDGGTSAGTGGAGGKGFLVMKRIVVPVA